jgi:hypothetical protein
MFGIDVDKRLFYEGSPSLYGFGIWPSPFTSIATLIAQQGDWDSIPATADLAWANLIFREDAFDPVTRIRRGRLYYRHQMQPAEWHVQRHPAYSNESARVDVTGLQVKSLYTYWPWVAGNNGLKAGNSTLFALGVRPAIRYGLC